MPATIQEAIRPVRDALLLNGADVEFQHEAEGIAFFQLTIADDACEECLLPNWMLESVLLEALKGSTGLSGVRILDPRADHPLQKRDE